MIYQNIFDIKELYFPILESIQEIVIFVLNAVDPIHIIENSLKINNDFLYVGDQRYQLSSFNRIVLIGLGKASQRMAVGAKQILNRWNLSGLVVTKTEDADLTKRLLPNIKTVLGSHPIPDEKSVLATDKIIETAETVVEEDLVICLISGGGSSLVTKPAEGITLEEIQNLTSQLLNCGASIQEINTLRKHLEMVKGGGLITLLYPARVIALILSDVIGDDLSMIASGPTVPDTTTFKDALEIMGKYHLDNSQNKKIIFHFKSGSKGVIPETLKENDPRFQKVQNVIVGNNYLAALAGKKKAEQLGFYCQLIPEQFIGDSVEVAEKIVRIIHDFNSNPYAKKPCCLIAGGEATVKVKGSGKGGRNQEVALRCAMEIEGLDNVCIATLATDGEDGPTDAAGAIVTGKSIAEARNKGIDPKLYLENNDSYNYFKKIGGLIHTGATGTNVNDLNFIFIL